MNWLTNEAWFKLPLQLKIQAISYREYSLVINKHNQKLTSIMENQRWQQGFGLWKWFLEIVSGRWNISFYENLVVIYGFS